jgi:hypothetical protein
MDRHPPIPQAGASHIQLQASSGSANRSTGQHTVTTPGMSANVPVAGNHPGMLGAQHAATNQLQNAGTTQPTRQVTFSLPDDGQAQTNFHPAPETGSQELSGSAASSSQVARPRIDHDGFMHQDEYRRLLPPRFRQAQVCGVVAMSDALGFVVPFDVVGNPEDGMTMPQLLGQLPQFGIRSTSTLLAGGTQMESDIRRFFTQANPDGAIIEYHWTDRRGGQASAASHFVSIRRFNWNGGSHWRLSDSRNDRQRWYFPVGQEAALARHLASLYRQGPPQTQRLEIRGLRHSSITNLAAHRATAEAFRNRTGRYADSSRQRQQTSTRPNTHAANVARMRALLADSTALQARDMALFRLRGNINLPESWTIAMLEEAEIEVISRENFGEEEEQDWLDHHPEQEAVPDDAVVVTVRHPTGGEWTYTSPATAQEAVALLDAEEAMQNNPAADFFAELGPQPVPTPAPITDGRQFFRLDLNAWERHLPPGTDAVDGRDAFHLSHLVGEYVAPAVFAEHATPGGNRLEQLLQAAQAGPGRTGTITEFTALDALQSFGRQTTHNVLALEYRSSGDGRDGLVVLRRDAQQRWLINSPRNGWQVLEQGGDLPAWLAEEVWNDANRDPSHPIRVLTLDDPSLDEAGDEAVADRLWQAYALMQPDEEQSPDNTAASTGASAPAALPNENETDDAFLERLDRTLRSEHVSSRAAAMSLARNFSSYVQEREPGLTLARLYRRGVWNSWADRFVRTPVYGARHRSWAHDYRVRTDVALSAAQRNYARHMAMIGRVLNGQPTCAHRPPVRQQTDFNRRATEAYERAGLRNSDDFEATLRRFERFIAQQRSTNEGSSIRPLDVDLWTYRTDLAAFDSYVSAFLNRYYPDRFIGEIAASHIQRVRGHLSRAYEFLTTGSMRDHRFDTRTSTPSVVRYSGY